MNLLRRNLACKIGGKTERTRESFLAKDCHQGGKSNPTMVPACENATWQGGAGEKVPLLPS